MLFDTHTHLCDERYDADREQIIADFAKNNVGRIVEIGANVDEAKLAVALANSHENVYATVGTHPYYCKDFTEESLETLRRLALSNPKVVAVGEAGLDYHDNHHEYKDAQIKAFELQIKLALELGLPLIVHVRDAYEDCLALLKKYYSTKADDIRPYNVNESSRKTVGSTISRPHLEEPHSSLNPESCPLSPGIIHCFSGDRAFMEEITAMGFHVAFGGALTYSNADNIKEAAKHAPLDKILIETDCPYLVPAGIHDSRNEPKYVSKVAELLAELKGLTTQEIEDITYKNACRLFKLGD
ncbi:MAG: TatD family hydrolase [Oscillospiraceae bacterium]|nr:TatD family hydrolase [Oscillospiraceae bacterium]